MAVITLSRQWGSDGDKIAELVCQRLGYQRFDKQSIAELGKQLGMAAGTVEVAAAAGPLPAKSLIERWFGNYEQPFGDPSGWTFAARQDAIQGISVASLIQLMNAGYKKGNVVIVGRGSMAALQDKPDVLHVRIIAPKELRIKRRQQEDGLTLEEAQAKVEARDRSDVEWIKQYFDLDAHKPELFDLVINTSKITPTAAADMIIKALENLPKSK